uniref:CNNM family magnesium/cobalt transport protein CorC n=1 Tax=Candidatus Aschnera chinzeii TaxID=1485666 RepID=A0AAT9G3U2_9ENTR|nr:MAG: CNNM family magnesium/cobalt transport protein CorC [Candidatus Aschnera chinzeii]
MSYNQYINFLKEKFFYYYRKIRYNQPQNYEELVKILKYLKTNNVFDANIKNILKNIIEIANIPVKNILMSTSQIITIKHNYTLLDCINIVNKHKYSYFPVVTENKKDIKGILRAKDLLYFKENNKKYFDINNILYPSKIISESQYVKSLLHEFYFHYYQIIIVTNEFGAISGLVSTKNILELFFGISNIQSNNNNTNIQQINKTTYFVNAITKIHEFNEIFKSNFNNDKFNTIGEMLLHHLGRLPKEGENIIINNCNFQIIIVNNYKIIKLLITIIPIKHIYDNI